MINAIIIDDEQGARDILKKLITRYCPEVNLLGEAASAEEGRMLLSQCQPNLVFLDIEMPYNTGFDLLKTLPSIDFEVIFVTGFDQYALSAIKFSALDYLLKPISEIELIQAINKAQKRIKKESINDRFSNFIENLQNEAHQKIGIPTLEGFLFIKIEEIVRCEAENRYTTLFMLEGEKVLATRNLKEFEDILKTRSFFRIHHSHLINLKYVEKFFKGDGSYVTMSDGAMVNVSRRRKDDLLQQLNTL